MGRMPHISPHTFVGLGISAAAANGSLRRRRRRIRSAASVKRIRHALSRLGPRSIGRTKLAPRPWQDQYSVFVGEASTGDGLEDVIGDVANVMGYRHDVDIRHVLIRSGVPIGVRCEVVHQRSLQSRVRRYHQDRLEVEAAVARTRGRGLCALGDRKIGNRDEDGSLSMGAVRVSDARGSRVSKDPLDLVPHPIENGVPRTAEVLKSNGH